MELFDRIGNITKSAVDKTANKVTIARVNSRIKSLKSGIEAQKLKIGEMYWFKHKDDKAIEPDMAESFKAIRAYLDQIASCESEIRAILESEEMARMAAYSANALCTLCGAQNSLDAKFCYGCGSPMQGTVAIPQQVGIKCSMCGAAMEEDSVFCGVCGAKRQG
ncbi:MAG: zinc ribbon domain-containing protein [Synergistaceae bacterium]|jgi:ribosomal protein L40E|nr:zinc ribbon domain-containing protein [Synergistaceae bacterium]